MKKYLLWFLVFVMICMIIFPAKMLAQDKQTVKFKAQVRVRNEADQRDFNSDTDFNTYSYLRTRFGVVLDPIENVSGFIQLQDSRIYGKEPSTLASEEKIDLHQAYIKVNHFLFKWLDIKLGRMELSYGDQRLLGAVGWHNVGRSFDGSVATINFSKKFKLDVIGARLDETSTPAGIATPVNLAASTPDEDDTNLAAFYANYNSSSSLNADFYVIALFDGTDVGNDNELAVATIGTFLRGKQDKISYKAELAFQVGQAASNDISSYMLTGSVGYTFADAKVKPTVTIGYDLISGDNKSDGKIKAFSTLFATNHKFYGYMDYFISIPGQTASLGLQDMMLKIKLKPKPKWVLGADFHNFLTAKKDPGGGKKSFGQEIDLVASYKFNKHFKWILGLSFFIPGKRMEAAFGKDDLGFWSHSSFVFSM